MKDGTMTEANPSLSERAASVATFLRERASEALDCELPEVSAGFQSMASRTDVIVCELLSLSQSLASANEEIERLREQWRAQRKALMQIAGQLPTGESPRKVAREALRAWCTPVRVSPLDALGDPQVEWVPPDSGGESALAR